MGAFLAEQTFILTLLVTINQIWLIAHRRRRGDLNPRAASTTYSLSRGASSAT